MKQELSQRELEVLRLAASGLTAKQTADVLGISASAVAMYLAKVMTPRSYPEIGRKFGGRDHSTVIHAVRLVEGLRQQDSEMDNDVRALLRQLEA